MNLTETNGGEQGSNMIRLFEQHVYRKQRELDGLWNVRIEGKEYKLPVPGCWEQHPDLMNHRGKATYIREVTVYDKHNVRLEFKGVSHTADVYWDDIKIAHHYNAYTAFEQVVKNVSTGKHTIRVEVDNSFSEESALHVPNDYYTYGGLIRPVVLEEIGDIYIKNMHFETHKTGDIWKVKISFTIVNLSENDCSGMAEIELADRTLKKEFCVEGSKDIAISFSEEVGSVLEWSSDSPNLYSLTAKLRDTSGKVIDDLIDRVGFREVSIKGREFRLNGKRVFLKGFNRHEDYGTLGCAVPVQVMSQDIDAFKDVGANAVRTCHYPNDERFLDMCDERGIMVWEENHARGLSLEKMENPNFDRQCSDCIQEMVTQHFNHPAIVIWGILNECASETDIGRAKYKSQYEQIKQLDTSRPTTSATCRHFTDICLDLPDVVSFNIYSGWYVDASVRQAHEKEMAWIDAAAGKEKPVIVSEFGAAALYGYRDHGHCKWSEERQADIISEHLNVYKEDERLTGAFVWQFSDCKVTEEEWFPSRARCHNNKGVVDEYRRPKEAYYAIKDLFHRM